MHLFFKWLAHESIWKVIQNFSGVILIGIIIQKLWFSIVVLSDVAKSS